MSTSRVVVVTGASAGIGRAVARRFGARGDRVALLARGEAGLDGARDDIRAAGGEALAVPVDVADAEAVDAAATTARRRSARSMCGLTSRSRRSSRRSSRSSRASSGG
jgi:NAD(P)-dependent dehydrogenase (short-subunit alcohol dehydrogenase family)